MATKTTVPTKIIVDCSTGEQTEVELTAEEIAQLELDQAQALAAQESAEAEAAARSPTCSRTETSSTRSNRRRNRGTRWQLAKTNC
jgi:hypothetical protein